MQMHACASTDRVSSRIKLNEGRFVNFHYGVRLIDVAGGKARMLTHHQHSALGKLPELLNDATAPLHVQVLHDLYVCKYSPAVLKGQRVIEIPLKADDG